MRPFLLIILAFTLTLASCISFPRAEMEARKRKDTPKDKAWNSNSAEGPAIGTRKNHRDPYFRE